MGLVNSDAMAIDGFQRHLLGVLFSFKMDPVDVLEHFLRRSKHTCDLAKKCGIWSGA